MALPATATPNAALRGSEPGTGASWLVEELQVELAALRAQHATELAALRAELSYVTKLLTYGWGIDSWDIVLGVRDRVLTVVGWLDRRAAS